jgi:hypothetical protein
MLLHIYFVLSGLLQNSKERYKTHLKICFGMFRKENEKEFSLPLIL